VGGIRLRYNWAWPGMAKVQIYFIINISRLIVFIFEIIL
jgi:hypothetical protein